MLWAQLKKWSFVTIPRLCPVSGCSEELFGVTLRTELSSELDLGTVRGEAGPVLRHDGKGEKNQVFSSRPPLLDPL